MSAGNSGRTGTLWLVALSVVLAGCAGGESSAAQELSTPDAGDEGDGGAIVGFVTDAESAPVAGAMVAVVDLGLETTTDDAGHFELSPVPAGTHNLFVQKLGFESIGKSVTVSAGETVEVTLTAEAISVEEPWVEVKEQTKHLEWGVRVVPVVGGRAAGDQSWSYETEDRTDAMDAMYIEMTWEGTQPTAKGMRLRVEVQGEANDLDYTFCVLEGPSPLTCHVTDDIQKVIDNDHSDCPADDTCEIQWRGFTGTGNTGLVVDFGVMLDQTFTVYVSHFYRQPMPNGYSAMPDA